MSEQVDHVVTEQTQTDPATITQPQAAPAPISNAENVDIEKIAQVVSARMEKSGEKIFQDMLKSKGLDDDTISAMTSEWKAKQVTPESENKRLSEELNAANELIKTMNESRVLGGLEIPDKMVDYYHRKITEHASDKNISFEDAASEYMKIDPLPEIQEKQVPPNLRGAGSNSKPPVAPTEAEELKSQYKEAAKKGDRANLVRIEMIAANKGIKII